MQIQVIPGKMESTWNEDVKAVVDTWTTYSVTLEEFKNAVLIKGIDFAKARHGIAWIVDSSTAKGAFSQEIQDFIGSDIFPGFVKNGIKYFITISSKVSPITNLTVKQYAAQAGPHGLKLIELNSADDAIKWLKANAFSKV
jgi:hypothetical protein